MDKWVQQLKFKYWGIVYLVLFGGIWMLFFSDLLLQKPSSPTVFFHLFVWIFFGAMAQLLESNDYKTNLFWGVLLSLGILALIWFLPVLMPQLKTTDLGISINLHDSLFVIWISVAFLFGYYHKLPGAFLGEFWRKLWSNEDKEEENYLRKFAKIRFMMIVQGLKQIFGF